MSGSIRYLADNEDGVSWFGRDGVSRHDARVEYAHLIGERAWPWRYKVSREFLRPADVSDCDAAQHGRGTAGDLLDDDCRCAFHEEEGWQYACEGDHPAAVAAWRVEPTYGPAWLWRLRHRRARLYRRFRGEGRPPVLWGGTVGRDVNRLDRLVAGKAVALVLHSSRQLTLGEAEWRWCDVCGAVRPHSLVGWDRPRCEATDHYDQARTRRETIA